MQPVMLVWPGGEHPFHLALGEFEGLQQKTDCGPEYLLLKLRSGQWSASELFETLRFGLIGGGMDQDAALKAVRNAFDRHPLISFKVPALAVLVGGLYGPADDPAGEDLPAGDPTPNPSPTGAGSSASTTA